MAQAPRSDGSAPSDDASSASTTGDAKGASVGDAKNTPSAKAARASGTVDEAAFYARADLPTHHGTFTVRVFREAFGEGSASGAAFDGPAPVGKEHLALSVGDLAGAEALPVRVHSECMTSEVFGSLKCDCRAQLEGALALIQQAGRGVVLYLRQEGRGIGLGNKIRAYQLQAEGADTVDANRLLGFADDLRSYEVAGEMLAALGVRSVRLITNNPSKIEGLRKVGVAVAGRMPLVAGVNSVNQGYLQTKRQRMGHLYATPAPGPQAPETPEHTEP